MFYFNTKTGKYSDVLNSNMFNFTNENLVCKTPREKNSLFF